MPMEPLIIAAIGSKLTILTAVDTIDVDMQKINEILSRAQLFAGGILIAAGSLFATISGLLRIIGLREEAMRRWKDVYMGVAMGLTGPAFVFLLATVIKILIKPLVLHA